MFALKYIEGLDNTEIASVFDTTAGTVAVTLHRVRARLMEDLGPYLGGLQ
jgi:DNA-directed RNA polymerase specialized sigma24 family protein